MKLAIMQPYFFPYAGYYNLVASSDKFIFYDDVNFIKNGWINRNRLFLSGDIRYITIPLAGASSNLKINEIKIQPKDKWQRKFLEAIKQGYCKAPNYKQTFDLIFEVIDSENEYISNIAKNSIIKTADRLSLDTNFITSSAIYKNQDLNGKDRVIDICLKESATKYINLPGGKTLYNVDDFSEKNITLEFVEPVLHEYTQFTKTFTPGLSILDMLMFNSFEDAKLLISETRNE